MTNFRLFAVAAVFALFSFSASAQPKEKFDWQERMMSEKIAFITAELELTPEEAQVFWPVYNQVAKEKMDSHKTMVESYFALRKALDEGKASDKEIDQLLEAYLAAKKANKDMDNDEAARFRKVLSGKKVAKLYVAEEKFRRQLIRHAKGRPEGAGPGGAPKR